MSTVNKQDLGQFLSETLNRLPEYTEAFRIVQYFSGGGKIWLVGSQIYRPLVGFLYGRHLPLHYDFDFLVERFPEDVSTVTVPEWERSVTGTGGIRLRRGAKQIDIALLAQAVSPTDVNRVADMSTQECLSSYLRRTPLTIQSVYFDIQQGDIVGPVGLQALHEQTIAVQNRAVCQQYCLRHHLTLSEFVERKAKALGFRAIH